jgi:hypothetical protein
MKITMEMSEYKAVTETSLTDYGDEVMCAGWNPQLAQTSNDAELNRHVALPASLVNVDPEVFLHKMYVYQR